MRLRSIKLAGFKSFVDPTTVNFPSNMAAVVGPNGCGKSNIIDAVRWGMGESSAKNLRGESMTDVIFNGSNSRKPVSQASIELIFDNSDHTLVGEYASYAEISIRRRVTREGQNTYFLNGTKCRRRDITDIFLGTGLGPRSYSIIEQGMISKLIEARPEDLRHYIEEAAGISKYKERRRETENRIRRTQENLARLTDLREELERQLERLHRQAQSAERFQAFKQEERQLKAQLQAVRWRELDNRVEQREKVIRDQETALEALIAEQRQADAGIERLRDGHHELSEAFNLVQGRFYSLGGDIARLEQTIQHGQQRQRQLQDDLREAEQARSEAESHLEHDRVLLATFEEELAMLEPEEEAARELGEEGSAALEEAELALADWQQRWEALSASRNGRRTCSRRASACWSRVWSAAWTGSAGYATSAPCWVRTAHPSAWSCWKSRSPKTNCCWRAWLNRSCRSPMACNSCEMNCWCWRANRVSARANCSGSKAVSPRWRLCSRPPWRLIPVLPSGSRPRVSLRRRSWRTTCRSLPAGSWQWKPCWAAICRRSAWMTSRRYGSTPSPAAP